MSALSKIESAGFILRLVDGNLNVTPTLAALTDKQHIFLREHKAEIIGDLKKKHSQDVIYTSGGENEYIDVHDIHHVHAKIDNGEISNGAVEWQELPEPKPGALLVTCYTPNGAAIEIEARDAEHAAWLKKMNPPQERGIK